MRRDGERTGQIGGDRKRGSKERGERGGERRRWGEMGVKR